MLPFLRGQFHIEKSKYPAAEKKGLKEVVEGFVTKQVPSSMRTGEGKISFGNQLFRFKVNRARNLTKAFNKGEITLSESDEQFEIRFNGSLHRGTIIACIQGLIAWGILYFNYPQYQFFGLVIFIISYGSSVLLTKLVFPRALSAEIVNYLKE